MQVKLEIKGRDSTGVIFSETFTADTYATMTDTALTEHVEAIYNDWNEDHGIEDFRYLVQITKIIVTEERETIY